MDPKFLHFVDSLMAYILWKFQADSLKIEAWRKNSSRNKITYNLWKFEIDSS